MYSLQSAIFSRFEKRRIYHADGNIFNYCKDNILINGVHEIPTHLRFTRRKSKTKAPIPESLSKEEIEILKNGGTLPKERFEKIFLEKEIPQEEDWKGKKSKEAIKKQYFINKALRKKNPPPEKKPKEPKPPKPPKPPKEKKEKDPNIPKAVKKKYVTKYIPKPVKPKKVKVKEIKPPKLKEIKPYVEPVLEVYVPKIIKEVKEIDISNINVKKRTPKIRTIKEVITYTPELNPNLNGKKPYKCGTVSYGVTVKSRKGHSSNYRCKIKLPDGKIQDMSYGNFISACRAYDRKMIYYYGYDYEYINFPSEAKCHPTIAKGYENIKLEPIKKEVEVIVRKVIDEEDAIKCEEEYQEALNKKIEKIKAKQSKKVELGKREENRKAKIEEFNKKLVEKSLEKYDVYVESVKKYNDEKLKKYQEAVEKRNQLVKDLEELARMKAEEQYQKNLILAEEKYKEKLENAKYGF
jgi:hypothetical protein